MIMVHSLGQNKVYLFVRGLSVIIGGILVHLTLGTLFSFGNIAPYIVSYIRNQSHPADLTLGTATWAFALGFLGQGSTMILGGWMVKRIGPRWTTLIGGWIMSVGVALTYFAIKVSFWLVLLTYGFLFGGGLGIAFSGPLTAAMKWLPKWKGFVNGIVMAGFGLGPLIFNFVQTLYVNPDDLKPEIGEDGEHYFFDPDLIHRVPYVFLVLGGIFAGMQLVGSLLLVDPPEGFRVQSRDKTQELYTGPYKEVNDDSFEESVENPDGVSPQLANQSTASNELPYKAEQEELLRDNEDPTYSHDMPQHLEPSETSTLPSRKNELISISPIQMLKKPGFYLLWLAFLFNNVAAVAVITLYKFFGLDVGVGDYFLAVVGAVAAIFNCLGRIGWGFLADKVSYKFAMVLITAIATIFLLTFYASTVGGREWYLVWVCVINLCIGGNFNVVPTALVRAYGIQYAAVNYGLLYTSIIIAGCAGALLSTFLIAILGYAWFFFMISGFSAAGLFMVLLYMPKRYISI
jgi:MFS family permease